MKTLIIGLLLTSFNLWARPVILVSYYDSFNKAPFNNSEKVARELEASLKSESAFEIKLCALKTVFDKSYVELEKCVKALPEKPLMILGLGEATCDLKIETMLRNEDQTFGPDNEGNNRDKTNIIPEAPKAIGLRYPLPQMYCSVAKSDRKDIEVSNSAGSFVCNNTAFQMSYYYPEIQSGFIHVPAHNCKKLEEKTKKAIEVLSAMIKTAASFLSEDLDRATLTPHTSNEKRLPVLKSELNILREEFKDDSCMQEYFKRSRGLDEKRSLWPF